ncbi:unnamed protein product [Mytilus coruscus]|uniref:Integrase p58-like C-terminal domain-containing protein n=1 Tax=Mytilus coruscus TaxID=42192 RepID=A0A6J8CQH0_MYTCO|nr:unnamed protein product [Mytilus coruscus]
MILEKAHEIARERLKSTAIRQKDYCDRNVKEINYASDYLVRRWQPHVVKVGKKKLYKNWTGPWVIVEKLTDVLFKIRHSKNSPIAVVYADNLKKYKVKKSVPWYKPEKTILHAQPPEINYFDREHEERRNDATENTHDTDKEPPIRMQSDKRQPDKTDHLSDKSLEPPDASLDKTLEPTDGSVVNSLEPPENSLDKTLELTEPSDGTGDRSNLLTSPKAPPKVTTRRGRIVRIPMRYR